MASYQQLHYCKNCKKNVSVNEKGQCINCFSTQIKKSWSVRFRFNESGIEIQKRLTGYKTKKEAENGYIDFINNSKKQLPKKENTFLFEELYEEFKQFQKSRIKESSFYDFYSKSNLHILPYFKKYEVSKITPKILLDWQNTINNYSFKHKSNLRSYLNSILKYAEKYYNIENQLKKVDGFRNVALKKEMLFWTPEEFNLFIKKVNREEYRAFFYALYYTGARKGELLATTWNDWDLKNNILNINKSITNKTFNGVYAITTPKNQSSIRKISFPQILADVIKKLKVGNENNNFVFFGESPLPDTTTKRIQQEACNKANVKTIRIHDFRHSHASLLISNGASIVSVAKRLGHINIEQTLNTYAHMMPKEDERILNILQSTTDTI